MTARDVIDALQLRPLPVEGGYFRQTWIAEERITATTRVVRYARPKPAGTAIYYLLTDEADGFSALHRLPADEVYHFYLGDPVEQLLLHPDGRAELVVLGHDLAAGQRVQHVAPRFAWQGSRLAPGGHFALLGTTMAPGFDPADYEPGVRTDLAARYPDLTDRILQLTRT